MNTIIKKESELNSIWNERMSLRAEGSKRFAEGNIFFAEGSKLFAEGSKLWDEGDKLRAEGNKLFAEAIIATYGNIKVEWKNGVECHLETGEVFRP